MCKIARFISSLKYWIYGPEIVYAEQFMYGGIETLRKFYAIERDLLLRGLLQHGWIGGGSSGGRPEIFVNFKHALDFVWSERVATELRELGRSNVQVIGSPWAHLVAKMENEGTQDSVSESVVSELLYIPAHSYPGWAFSPRPEFLSASPRSKKSVLLSWMDFIDPAIRKSFLQNGYRVECAGYRGSSAYEVPWSDNGGRVRFLEELYKIVSAARLIAVDDISTPFWYALSLRKPIIITNKEICLPYWDRNTKRNETFISNNESIAESLGLSHLPIGSVVQPSAELVELARRELGFDSVGKSNRFFESPKYCFESKV